MLSVLFLYFRIGLFNTKFISNDGDGKYEGVYDKRGLLLTEENDPVNMGTYNYCSFSVDMRKHATLDMVPYYIWGNVKGCPAGKARDVKDFYSNKEAQEAYSKVKRIMDEK